MKIPKTINILGKKIRIKKISSWKGHDDVSEQMVGRYYPDTQTIYIYTKWPLQVQFEFLLHEINHVIMFITGINQTMNLQLEECIAQSFASVYSDLIKLKWKTK